MSSAVYIAAKQPISREEWLEFCKERSIEYSPNTVGQNIFYGGDSRQVEISFGSCGTVQTVNGVSDFSTATPPESAAKVVVSSYIMSNLLDIARIADAIIRRWDCECECDPELAELMLEVRNDI